MNKYKELLFTVNIFTIKEYLNKNDYVSLAIKYFSLKKKKYISTFDLIELI